MSVSFKLSVTATQHDVTVGAVCLISILTRSSLLELLFKYIVTKFRDGILIPICCKRPKKKFYIIPPFFSVVNSLFHCREGLFTVPTLISIICPLIRQEAQCASQMATNFLYSALLLTRAHSALIKRSALRRE